MPEIFDEVIDCKIPESVRQRWAKINGEDTCPHVVSIGECTTEREGNGLTRARIDQKKDAVNEVVKMSIAKLDGEPVTIAQVDDFWRKCPRKLRDLVQTAFGMHNFPSKDEGECFFAGFGPKDQEAEDQG